MNKYATKEKAKALSKETQVGLLFCYKALKRCEDDYQRAYLTFMIFQKCVSLY